MIEIIIAYSIFITIKCYDFYKKYKINYSNYQNSLKALAEYDPELKKYLEHQEKKRHGK